jgi:hypothetical protein
MSGYTDNVIGQQGVGSSEQTIINKPLLPIALANKIREVLDSRNEKSQVILKNEVSTE